MCKVCDDNPVLDNAGFRLVRKGRQMIKRDENGKIIIRGKRVNYNLGINLETRQLLKNIIFWCECVDTRDRLYNLVIMIERKLKEEKEDK